VRAGRLDRRVWLLRSGAAVDDGYGTVPGALQRLGKRWASFQSARGRELLESGAIRAVRSGTFWVRHDTLTAGLDERDRVFWDGLVWEIAAIGTVGRRDGIELIVTADPAQARIDVDALAMWTPGGGAGSPGTMDFSDPANSGLLALLRLAGAASVGAAGTFDFSQTQNSGLLAVF